MKSYELAQLNVARMMAPIDSPLLADFVANLDRINALAEASAGFVWRLQTEEGDATAVRHFGDDMLVNLSVWEDVKALHNYVFKSAHTEIMGRRKEWFSRMQQAYLVLWWVPAGHRPTLAECERKLMLLRRDGAGPEAFTFRNPYPAPDVGDSTAPQSFDDCCPASP